MPWTIAKSTRSGWNICDESGNHVCRVYDGNNGEWRHAIRALPQLMNTLGMIAEADVQPGHVAYMSKPRIAEVASAALAQAKPKN